MTKTILLTGGAGYIGAHTFVALHKAGYTPVIFDNFSNSDSDTPDRITTITGQPVTVIKGDLLDKDALNHAFQAHDFTAVIHFAALKSVGQSVAEPLRYIENNNIGLINLASAMTQHGVKTVVFSSSATVYGDPTELPIPETAPLSYTNPYGFTKLMGEQILNQMPDDWVVGILRYFNPAGIHPSGLLNLSPRNASLPPENLMPLLQDAALGLRPPLSVFGDDYDTPDGTGVRDYIHILDLARGHVLSLDKLLLSGKGHTVNLGTGRGYSVLEMIKTFERVNDMPVPYHIAPRRAGDIASCYADVSLAREVLGFEAEYDLDDICKMPPKATA